MDQSESLSYYQWITKIGVILFVAFSYFYFESISELQSDLGELNAQIEIENATIDNTTNNTTKRQLIQANLARAENAASLSRTLTVNRIVIGLFMLVGLGASVYGFINIRKLIAEDESEEV